MSSGFGAGSGLEPEDNIRPLPVRRAPETHELPKRAQIQSDKVTQAKARHRVLELAAAGLTDEQIAVETQKTPRAIRTMITKQLKKWADHNSGHLEEYRAQKVFELDQLKRAIWANALRGDLKAVREATRIVQMQADISGAGAPAQHKHEHEVRDNRIDEAEVRRMEQAWVESGPRQMPLIEDIECSTPEEPEVVDAEIADDA